MVNTTFNLVAIMGKDITYLPPEIRKYILMSDNMYLLFKNYNFF